MEPIPPSLSPYLQENHHKSLHHHHLGPSGINELKSYGDLPYQIENNRYVAPFENLYRPPPPVRYSHINEFDHYNQYDIDNNYHGYREYEKVNGYNQYDNNYHGYREYENVNGYNQYDNNYYNGVQRPPPLGHSYIEYKKFERKFIEEVPIERIEYVPVERSVQDYCAIEKRIEYVPKSRFETKIEYVPQQFVDHIPQTYTEYIPVKKQEMVQVEKVQEKLEYQVVDRSVLHYPNRDGQFVDDAEKSGRIREDLIGAYGPTVIRNQNNQARFPPNNLSKSNFNLYNSRKDLNLSKDNSLIDYNNRNNMMNNKYNKNINLNNYNNNVVNGNAYQQYGQNNQYNYAYNGQNANNNNQVFNGQNSNNGYNYNGYNYGFNGQNVNDQFGNSSLERSNLAYERNMVDSKGKKNKVKSDLEDLKKNLESYDHYVK